MPIPTKIVGWKLADTLRASATMTALRQAIKQAIEMTGNEKFPGLIHHSDRGVQYCCDTYVELLQQHDITISMTEDYKPTGQCRSGTCKWNYKGGACLPERQFNDIGHAENVIGRYIHFYNYHRPHMSIGYKIPAIAHLENGVQIKKWQKKKYPAKENREQEYPLSFAKPNNRIGRRHMPASLKKTMCPIRGAYCLTEQTETDSCKSGVSLIDDYHIGD